MLTFLRANLALLIFANATARHYVGAMMLLQCLCHYIRDLICFALFLKHYSLFCIAAKRKVRLSGSWLQVLYLHRTGFCILRV